MSGIHLSWVCKVSRWLRGNLSRSLLRLLEDALRSSGFMMNWHSMLTIDAKSAGYMSMRCQHHSQKGRGHPWWWLILYLLIMSGCAHLKELSLQGSCFVQARVMMGISPMIKPSIMLKRWWWSLRNIIKMKIMFLSLIMHLLTQNKPMTHSQCGTCLRDARSGGLMFQSEINMGKLCWVPIKRHRWSRPGLQMDFSKMGYHKNFIGLRGISMLENSKGWHKSWWNRALMLHTWRCSASNANWVQQHVAVTRFYSISHISSMLKQFWNSHAR